MFFPNRITLAAIGDISSGSIWAMVLGTLLAVVAIALLVASWTKWGQTKSLTKCIAIAFLAHVWLLMYAYGTRIVTPGFGGGSQGGTKTEAALASVPILAIEELAPSDESPLADDVPSDRPVDESAPSPWEAPLKRVAQVEQQSSDTSHDEMPKIPELVPASANALRSLEKESPPPELPSIDSIEQISQLAAITNQVAQPHPITPAPDPNRSFSQASAPPPQRRVDQRPVPTNYQMRLSPQRSQFAIQNGGDANTEASVEGALAWLARAQGPDGGWNAAEHGAGNVTTATLKRAGNENRDNAGRKANTAMTGLALLAFLGAGHTHTDGRYKENVAAGLRYLLSQQFQKSGDQGTGDLCGRDQVGRQEPTVRFARMYSHGMAALALAEAYGMTGDPALLPAIRDACDYSHAAMNPQTGGWRYEFPTGDPGDLSQFGWQAMLLNSASNHRSYELSQQSRFLMHRFLDSVSTGRHGGLAVYRPVPGMIATPAMTAEALASRLLLGFPLTATAADEGQRMLLKNLPGQSEENLYYWYYATLAMYQMRGDTLGTPHSNFVANNSSDAAWIQWNEAIKKQLCSTQVPHGKMEGSWNPSCVWGEYGGRVYSTAMACMCLEVYYRYLPMYKPEQFANQWQPARR